MSLSTFKRVVLERVKCLCEYCKSPTSIFSQPFSIEHIIPKSRGGETSENNLALSCQGCNNYKYIKTKGLDRISGLVATLFHPRQDNWADHFAWSDDGVEIIGISSKGRVTVEELRLNRNQLKNLRCLLVDAGIHPPE